ncbi:hypothetical protein GGI20_000695 [Coemansia sp. BCRC 34301]|nr:hypothetical protein GGI20_000695 [Coemansia sp. BCRC 34301]
MVLLKQLLALVLPAVASHLHWSAEQGPAPYPVAQGSVTAAPFSGIPRQHILNVPATPNLTAYSAATGAIYTGSNGRCRRAIRHHPQSCRLILKHCAGYGHGVVDYVDLYYCRYTAHRATVLALISAWLALLFVWLGVSASEYFSPNISFLAQLMRLPESLAGVTLLALGNGAPDLFSTFSAVRAGSGALALGQLIGSASFIVSVVVGATTLVVPVYRVSQLSYLRELFFFAATIGMVAVIVLSERLSRGLAMCMVGLYGAYVVTVMVTTYYEEQSLAPESPVDGISSNPAVPVQADRPADGSHQSPSLLAAASPWSKAPGSTAPYLAPVSGAPVAKISKAQAVVYICVPTLRHWRPEASSYLKLFIAFSALPVLLLSVTVPVLACLPEPKEGASDFRELGASSEDDDSIGNDYCSSQLHSTATSRELERWERHAEPDGPDTHLSLHIHRPPTERASLSRPSSLHMALDDLANGHSVQALNAATIAWAEKVVSSVRSFMSAAFLYSVLGLGGYFALDTGQATSVLLGLALATTSLLGNHFSRRAQQRHYWLQVAPCFFGFVCGLAWIYIIANEVVSITQALGLILGLSEEILGLTVVGFGNSLGDLVTNLTLTRMGYPMMALSACFGGPMLCLLIGVGVAAYGIMAGSGPDDDGMYHMPITSPTVLVSTACLLLNSLIYLVAIPRLNYHMTRAVGLAVLAVYFTGMAVNIYLEW